MTTSTPGALDAERDERASTAGGRGAGSEPPWWRRRVALVLVRGAERARDRGDCAWAAVLYRRAVALNPRRPAIRVQLAQMLRELTRFDEAEAAYRQALAQSPDDGDIRLQLRQLLSLLGRTDGAPDTPLEPSETSAAAAAALIADADRLRDGGQFDGAAEAYGSALRLLPGRTDIRIQHGNMLKDSGRLAEAEAAYRTALAQAPEEAEIHLQLGHALKLQGRRADALACYRRAADLQPTLEAARWELFHAGCPEDQQQLFEMQLARGGVEALLAMGAEVARLQRTVTRLAAALPDPSAQAAFPAASYDLFRRIYDVPSPPPAAVARSFGIVLAAQGVPLATLYAQLAAVAGQSYPHWRLAVVGSDPAQRRAIERAAAGDPRIAWIEAPADEPADAAERRTALSLATDWLVLPAAGAQLHRHALGWCAGVAGEGAASAFVTDEEAVAGHGGEARRIAPQLRQTVDYDTLLAANPFGDTIFIEHAAYARAAGKLAAGSLAAARSSLLLALARGGTVGHLPLPLVAVETPAEGDTVTAAAAREAAHAAAVRLHLAAAGLAGRVTQVPLAEGAPAAVLWQPRDPQQPIAAIVPTRDNAADLRDFVASLRRCAAAPEALRVVIVDNGSIEPESARILAQLAAEDWVRVVRLAEPFNWSRLNNRAAALAGCELLVFANDDMLMLTDGWDRQLRGLLERPEIGAVGARLLYPDDSVQHAGVLLGWPGIALHDGRYEALADPGPGRRWQVPRAVSAVTGAFLATRRSLFEMVDGFDETGLPVAYSDVDFALKLRRRGLKILWTPSITLRHFESKSRGIDGFDLEKRVRNAAEMQTMRQRWGAALQVDPGVNPAWHNATLPFRLLSAPAAERLGRHIRLCAAANPWLPLPPAALQQDPEPTA